MIAWQAKVSLCWATTTHKEQNNETLTNSTTSTTIRKITKQKQQREFVDNYRFARVFSRGTTKGSTDLRKEDEKEKKK